MFFRKKGDLEERLTLLEAKYEQLAKEVGRIEKDLIKMFKLIEIEEIISIPPKRFSEDIHDVVLDILQKDYEEKITSELGIIIAVIEVIEIGIGRIIHGDGSTHHRCRFKILTFKPDMHEIVEGKIVEIVDFGIFIRLGCVDGLVHVSQITDDYITFDGSSSMLIGKETGRQLRENDVVRARIVAISIGAGGTRSGKLGLTMRQDWLGKIEWIKERIQMIKEGVPLPEIREKRKTTTSRKSTKRTSTSTKKTTTSKKSTKRSSKKR